MLAIIVNIITTSASAPHCDCNKEEGEREKRREEEEGKESERKGERKRKGEKE